MANTPAIHSLLVNKYDAPEKRRRPVYPLGLSVGSVCEPLDGAGNRGSGIHDVKPRAWRSARVSITGTCIGHLSLVNKVSSSDNRNGPQ